MTKTFTFSAPVWLYPGKSAWHFITVPKETSQEIDEYFSHVKRGWGSLPVSVRTGQTEWKTSIFPDKKTEAYLLPLKALARKQADIRVGDEAQVTLTIFD